MAVATNTPAANGLNAAAPAEAAHLSIVVLPFEVDAAPDEQISLSDPDARSMATSGKGTGVVGDNVQAAVNTQHHLIVAHEVVADRISDHPPCQQEPSRSPPTSVAHPLSRLLGTDNLSISCRSKLTPPRNSVIRPMPASVIVWDIETVPDLRGFEAANGLTGKTDDEVRAEMGDKFPKLIFHSIVCIGALVAQRQEEHWSVVAVGAPHIGERLEKEIISAFVKRIAELAPQLVTFNGASFDLPVLRYRAMVCGVAAPGLAQRPYFNRYTEDAIDLCDVLSCFSPQNKPSLHELCRVMGLPGKPDGISGADVERFCREVRVAGGRRLLRERRREHVPSLADATSCFADV